MAAEAERRSKPWRTGHAARYQASPVQTHRPLGTRLVGLPAHSGPAIDLVQRTKGQDKHLSIEHDSTNAEGAC